MCALRASLPGVVSVGQVSRLGSWRSWNAALVGGLRTRLGGEAIARQSAVCGTIYAVTVIHMLDGRKSKTAEKERIS